MLSPDDNNDKEIPHAPVDLSGASRPAGTGSIFVPSAIVAAIARLFGNHADTV
jgi:hypothetical protein